MGGFVLLISLIYVTYDKRLAFRLSVLTLLTMSLNHLLKSLIMNPRPFVTEGSYADRWAVSGAKAEELATEYSTPSGHAMAGAAFYTYLYASLRNGYVRATCVLLILLTGLSRPYLGVHYLEDVLIGWALGIAIALLATGYAETIQSLWGRLSHPQQIGTVAAGSFALWLATRLLSGWEAENQPLAFVGYTGFLTGIVIASVAPFRPGDPELSFPHARSTPSPIRSYDRDCAGGSAAAPCRPARRVQCAPLP